MTTDQVWGSSPGRVLVQVPVRVADVGGWKVNGAGGDGGSLTALAPDAEGAAALAQAWQAHEPGWVVPELRLAQPQPGSGTERGPAPLTA